MSKNSTNNDCDVSGSENSGSNFTTLSVSDFLSVGIFGPGGFLSEFQKQNETKPLEAREIVRKENVKINEFDAGDQNSSAGTETSIKLDAKPGSSLQESESIDYVPNSCDIDETLGDHDLSIAEAVLNIDLILEQIISYLYFTDLKSTRLVSHRWNYFCATRLEKFTRIEPSFSNKPLKFVPGASKDEYPDEVFKYFCSTTSNTRFTEPEDPDSLINEFYCMLEASPKFPCSTFEFDTQKLCSPHIQHFLNTTGPYIKSLKLTLPILLLPLSHVFQENTFLEDLRRIFVKQCPILEYFELELWLPRRWGPDMIKWVEDSNHFFDCNNNMGEKGRVLPILPKLKTAIVRGTGPIPKVMIEEIKQAAINLKTPHLVEYPFLAYI